MISNKGGELTHAYVVSGSSEKIPAILEFVKKAGITITANPDVYIREYLNFGIDAARALRERAYARAVAGDRRVFIIVTPSMTHDAQNALLKTLEEPPADAVFFFVVASPNALLPTLRSRAAMLPFDAASATVPTTARFYLAVDIGKFLAATREERIDIVKPLYAREEGEERDVRDAVSFLSGLEQALSKDVKDEGARRGIHAIYLARRHLMDKGSLLKPLLEQVALLVPRS